MQNAAASLLSRPTGSEEKLEDFKARALLVIRDAFSGCPLDTVPHALARWFEIDGKCLAPARREFCDSREAQAARQDIVEANDDCDIDAVIRAADAYFATIEGDVIC
jgi:hypothetical protein